MSHTPGPWKVSTRFVDGGHYPAIYREDAVAQWGKPPIAELRDAVLEREANVYLIAAAPELLEALQCVFSWAMEAEQETGKPIGEGLGYKGKMQLPVAMERARLAIRKATGQ